MCNNFDSMEEEGGARLRERELRGREVQGKGVLVVAGSLDVAQAVVERLSGHASMILVATADALELSRIFAHPREGKSVIHGMTVDLARREEVARVFRWVDGMLSHLDILVSVVEGKTRGVRPEEDVLAWQKMLEERWVTPLLFVEEAAVRMRKRHAGHILQVSLQGSHEQTGSGGLENGNDPLWGTLRDMLEARRMDLGRAGIRLTLLEVEACGAGAATCSRLSPSPADAGAAVEFCLRQTHGCVVEVLRLSPARA